jgi:hypothetical protein
LAGRIDQAQGGFLARQRLPVDVPSQPDCGLPVLRHEFHYRKEGTVTVASLNNHKEGKVVMLGSFFGLEFGCFYQREKRDARPGLFLLILAGEFDRLDFFRKLLFQVFHRPRTGFQNIAPDPDYIGCALSEKKMSCDGNNCEKAAGRINWRMIPPNFA